MSATTTERRESTGFVAETLRRPIQEAVKEGVKEAIREDEEIRVRQSGSDATGEDESGGGGRGKMGMLLLLLGVGVAAMMFWRRRGGSDGGGMTESLREGSKTDEPVADTGGSEVEGGAVETTEQDVEAEDAPEASSE